MDRQIEVTNVSETGNTLKTSGLWDQLFKAPSLDEFFGRNESEVRLSPFFEYINTLCKEKGECPARVIARSGIERSYGYQVFRGDRKPSRDTVLLLAFGFEADVALAQALLKRAGFSVLYPRVRRDVVIAYSLRCGISLADTQSALVELGLPAIGAMPR